MLFYSIIPSSLFYSVVYYVSPTLLSFDLLSRLYLYYYLFPTTSLLIPCLLDPNYYPLFIACFCSCFCVFTICIYRCSFPVLCCIDFLFFPILFVLHLAMTCLCFCYFIPIFCLIVFSCRYCYISFVLAYRSFLSMFLSIIFLLFLSSLHLARSIPTILVDLSSLLFFFCLIPLVYVFCCHLFTVWCCYRFSAFYNSLG